MYPAGRRGAYRKEDRAELSKELQMELVESAARKFGNCQELAKALGLPKSSVHYYRSGRLTLPLSVMEQMLEIARDDKLEGKVREAVVTKDRTWANAYAAGINREMCRERVRLPTVEELEQDDELRRKAAAIVSYVMAEGSVWLQKEKWGECAVNITFADHEEDLYNHFRGLCLTVFKYDLGPPQLPGNGARAIRGFIYSRFVAEWLIENGVAQGEKSAQTMHLPHWIMDSADPETWRAAVQPWCDGEGTVSRTSRARTFRITQSRHTPITFQEIPQSLMNERCKYVLGNSLDTVNRGAVSVLEFCHTNCRSEILDDVRVLFLDLGFEPTSSIDRLALKNDGYWSCVWDLLFCSEDAKKLLGQGVIMQLRKVNSLKARYI
jgi:hypothetical protein